MNRICVFCGSSTGDDPAYAESCRQIAKILCDRNISIVYGGGNVGLMGVLADAMLELGGEVTGVIPQKLVDYELAHRGITSLRIVGTMHERKALMAQLSDGFIALPGGVGTLEEIIEVYTWTQLGFHHKPCGLLNVAGYYDPLQGFLDSMVERGFLRQTHRDQLIVEEDPEKLISRLSAIELTKQEKWAQRQ